MKQTFNIPKDCDKVTFEQIGNQIVTTFGPKQREFKKSDFVTLMYQEQTLIAILKYDVNFHAGCVYSAIALIDFSDAFSINSSFDVSAQDVWRLSTTEERQLILSKLEEKGYRYNEETCELERIKWEPKEGEKYCFINSYGFIQEEIHTWRTPLRTNSDLINCFKPNSLDQDKVKRLFAEFIQNVKYEHGIDY